MDPSVTKFYDDLAPVYHLIYHDWDEAIQRQSQALHELIQSLSPSARRILDCSCGIGTQAIGLSQLGYEVEGQDVSPKAVERAKAEAAKRNAEIQFHTGDIRNLVGDGEPFDVVLAGDNSLPHLLTDTDLRQAVQGMRAVLRPGGLLVASMRDYDALLEERSTSTPIKLIDELERRRFVFSCGTGRMTARTDSRCFC